MNSVSNFTACGRTLRVFATLAAMLAMGAAFTNATARQQKPKPTVEVADLANRLHAQINQERTRHGLAALAWSDTLSRIATKHSRDMADRQYLSHDSPEGKDFSFRYQQEGFACVIRAGRMVYSGAENIALSHLYNSMTREDGIAYYDWNSAQEIARRTVDGWMNSPGHRKNILMPHWRQEGIGIEIESSPGNRIYITQNFC